MTATRKHASPKAHALLKKLEAFAERGIDGEKLSAQRKIERLKARFDFTTGALADMPDLFSGTFKRSKIAKPIWSFSQREFDIANAIKWAIESATGISCVYSGQALLAEAAKGTAVRLGDIAGTIANNFRELIGRFSGIDGVSFADRSVFVMGLYDGMMNTPRDVGQPLPGRRAPKQRRWAKKPVVNQGTHLHTHPYTLAFSLGRQIRFSVPLHDITAHLASYTPPRLPAKAAAYPGKAATPGVEDRTAARALPG